MLAFVLYSDHHSVFQLSNLIQAQLVPKFSALPGGNVDYENLYPEIKIQLHPEAMVQYGLSANDIANPFYIAKKAYQYVSDLKKRFQARSISPTFKICRRP